MTLFLKYIRQHRRQMVSFAVCCLIFLVVFALYHLPVMAVVYPALLCTLFLLFLAVTDYKETKQRHDGLLRIQRLTAAMLNELPEAGSIEAEDYQEIIRSMQEELCGLETSSETKYHDMMEYYTIWVHQIKTPIAAMRLRLQSEDTAEARRLLSDLFRIEQYVEMALAYLRLDSPVNDYVFREHEVDTVIRQAVKKFSGEFIGRKISLVYEPADKRIVTDDKWLSFVIEQLISNALKYTKKGSVSIYMEEADVLCIKDTGIGIAAEDLPRIFEYGYTGLNGRADKKASGIGLYLCRRICGDLGIALTADSEPGVGTCMSLRLNQYQVRGE